MDERHIVAIDLGTSKFALTVAKIEGANTHIIYYKETPSEGIRYSRVFHPTKASAVLKKAIGEAEQELGIKITQVVVGLPKYEVQQQSAQMKLERNPEECITQEEINNMKEMAMDTYPLDHPDTEMLFGAVAQSFSNEEEFQLVENDIIGMASREIEGNFKLFIGRLSSIKNIDLVFNNIGICVARKYFTSDSTARAVLYESETDNGVALIDFGAGVTTVSVYSGNVMRHYAAIPFGGDIITRDIKSESSISERLAENIKLAYGACMPDKLQSMSEKVLHISSNAATPTKQLSVKYLSEIITARTREIIEAVLYEIEQSGLADQLKSGIVLTGGCANMLNCANFIKELSGYSVRTGYPKRMFSATGCDGIYESSASVSIGMILAARQEKNLNCLLPATQEKAGGISIEGKEEAANGNKEEASIENESPMGGDGTLFGEEEVETVSSKPKEKNRGKDKKPDDRKKGSEPIWIKVGNLFENWYNDISKEEV